MFQEKMTRELSIIQFKAMVHLMLQMLWSVLWLVN